MEPSHTIFLKIEIRDDMRPVDLIFVVRYRRFDSRWSKIGGEEAETHPSGGFWPVSQCRGTVFFLRICQKAKKNQNTDLRVKKKLKKNSPLRGEKS